MEMDRSKQRIFEILIFYFLLVIISNTDLIKNFPIEEYQTEQKFFLSVYGKFSIVIISNVNIIKKTS